ncbi:MAG: winged helix-turn-helix transcriptional regulator [Bacteroidales bacterium]|nr:winged helix-turn-helix transcriptional regulator [Bacteroidales bacterium]
MSYGTENAPVNAPVNKTQKAILKLISKDNQITYDEMVLKIGVDRTTIMRNIAKLKQRGILERVGEDKNGYWKLNI